jgi:hypothetical protein
VADFGYIFRNDALLAGGYVRTHKSNFSNDELGAKVLKVLAVGRALTAGQLVEQTGLDWYEVDAGILALGAKVGRIACHPECFVLREFLEP